jgi:hypothetical protein
MGSVLEVWRCKSAKSWTQKPFLTVAVLAGEDNTQTFCCLVQVTMKLTAPFKI